MHDVGGVHQRHITCGMFMSSIKMRSRLPGGGPYVSFVLFSTLASKFLCTSKDVVLLEKFIFSNSCKNIKKRHIDILKLASICDSFIFMKLCKC